MHKRTQKICALSGLLGIALFFGGILMAGFFPPPPPSLSMEEVVRLYQENTLGIRFGFLTMMISGMFVFPLVSVISVQIRRIEGSEFPIMTYTQLAAGIGGIMFFIIPAVPFLVTAFRPDRNPELTYLMNDFSWIMLVLVWPPAFMQNLSIAVAILKDKSPNPLFPRWLAYFNLWVAVGFTTACTLVFFKEEPFSWNSIFPFWIPATVFGAWFIVIVWMLFRAIDKDYYREC